MIMYCTIGYYSLLISSKLLQSNPLSRLLSVEGRLPDAVTSSSDKGNEGKEKKGDKDEDTIVISLFRWLEQTKELTCRSN
jgi:hypothetical protein